MFAELNERVVRPKVSQGENGFTLFLNGEAVCGKYNDLAFEGVQANPNHHCEPGSQFLHTMASVNMFWRTVSEDCLNTMLPFTRNTGPCLSICRRNHTPNLPEDFKELAYLVSCVNSMPNYDGCIVPTPETRLKWSPDHHHVVGLRHMQAGIEERYRHKEEVERQGPEAKTFLGIEVPRADAVGFARDDASDDDVFVTVDVAMLVVSIVPVLYEKEGQQFKETYWVGTVLPQPGVDLLRCLEKLGRPPGVQHPQDARLAQERANRWAHLNYVEPYRCYKLSIREWDLLASGSVADNLTDRRHPYLTMNPTSTLHKIIQSLPHGVERCQIVGMPPVHSGEDFRRLYDIHVENWHMCIQWAKEFSALSEQIWQLPPSSRRFIPPLNLPAVPGTPFLDGAGEVTYSILGEPPLNFLWKPMLQMDSRLSYEEFFVGKLPKLVQGTLMSWIFDGDILEFIGTEQEVRLAFGDAPSRPADLVVWGGRR